MSSAHIEENLLEEYAMGRSLPEPSLAEVEEHLLTCKACQTRLEMLDKFVTAFRAVAVQSQVEASRRESPPPWWVRPLWAAPVLCMAALVILLISGTPGVRNAVPATVVMRTFRGAAEAPIRAGRPVRLVFDLGTPAQSDSYEIEFVDLSGKPVLVLHAPGRDGRLEVSVERLRAGSYWVRAYAEHPERRLLQEYPLKAE
jgi:hypothetical protein